MDKPFVEHMYLTFGTEVSDNFLLYPYQVRIWLSVISVGNMFLFVYPVGICTYVGTYILTYTVSSSLFLNFFV